MTFRVRLLLALDAIGKNIRKFLGEMVMLIVCLFALSVSMFMRAQADYCKSTLNLILKEDVSKTGTLSIEEYDSEEAQHFYQEARKDENIHSIGSMEIGATDILPELTDIQGNHKSYIYERNMLECYYMESGLLNLCNTTLLDGAIIEDTSDYDDNWNGLYLGYEYKEIPIGTKYEYVLSDGTVETFEVLGIFDKSSRWVNDKIFSPSSMAATKLYMDLDYAVIMITDKTMPSYTGIFSSDNYMKAKEALTNLADKYGLSLQVSNFEKQLEEGTRQSGTFQNLLIRIFLLLAMSVIVCECSFQIVSIWRNSYQYGILVSLGSKMKDIISIVIVGEVIKYLISFLLSALLSFVFIKYYFTIAGDEMGILSDLMWHYVFPRAFVAGMMISIAGTIVPLIRLGRLSPIEMLKYNPTNIE